MTTDAMEDTIFLLVKVRIEHRHVRVHDAIDELQKQAVCIITETENVKIIDVQVMDYKLKT